MNPSVHLTDQAVGIFANLPAELRHASCPVAEAMHCDVLLNLALVDGDHAIAAATAFAAAPVPDGRDRLVLSLCPAASREDWVASRNAAALAAFTRYAALAWAPLGIRVNAVTFTRAERHVPNGDVSADIVDLLCAMWRWRSMTGQLITLSGRV